MPVARIITTSPAESEALRRQLITAGYSVKFAAPDEEFSDADLVVAAANVHVDYALQYASEVAEEAKADVIVAPGVVRGSVERFEAPVRREAEPVIAPRETKPVDAVPIAGALFGAAGEAKAALSESGSEIRETLTSYGARVGDAWQRFRQERELAAERKRLDREQREIEREEQRRNLQQKRMEAEARMAGERERLRLQRQAEQERLRREQQEMRRAMEEERARVAAERERIAQTTPAPAAAPPMVQATQAPPVSPVSRPPMAARAGGRRPLAPARRPVARRLDGRDRRFQRAAFVASVVALLAMLGFAVAMNIHPSAPIPHSMVQNPVQEKSPFGAASITPVATTKTVATKPAAHPVLPQNDAAPAKPPAAKAKPSPTRTRRASRDNYVAEDEVIIHHYGATAAQKHPPAAQTQAGVRKYTDQE